MQAKKNMQKIWFSKGLFKRKVLFIWKNFVLQKIVQTKSSVHMKECGSAKDCSNEKFCSYERIRFCKRLFKRKVLFIWKNLVLQKIVQTKSSVHTKEFVLETVCLGTECLFGNRVCLGTFDKIKCCIHKNDRPAFSKIKTSCVQRFARIVVNSNSESSFTYTSM